MEKVVPLADDWQEVDTFNDCQVADVEWASQLSFWLNGKKIAVKNPSPSITLVDWLRESKGLTGTHIGCHEGGCGICTVTLTRVDPVSGDTEVLPINSCLRRLCGLDGCHITTTEGLGSQTKGFHAIQRAIADGNGSQCGYCTPGWVMNMYSLLQKSPTPSAEEIEQNFDGNLCRCTGYRPILTAMGTFAKGGRRCGQHFNVADAAPAGVLAVSPQPLRFEDSATQQLWYRPVTLAQFQAASTEANGVGKTVRIICANTAEGVEKYFGATNRTEFNTAFIDISVLPDLQGVAFTPDTGLVVGAAVSITALIAALKGNSEQSSSYLPLARHMERIASVQIRSVASWIGNLMLTRTHNNFPSDMATILSAAGATVKYLASGGTGAAQTISVPGLLKLTGDDILVTSLTVPVVPAGSLFQTYKTAQRHVFAHAIVNCAALVHFKSGTPGVVDQASIFVGGATEVLLNATKTAAALQGQSLNQDTFARASSALSGEINAQGPSRDARHTQAYRHELAAGFLYKLFLTAQHQSLPARFQSAVVPFIAAADRPVSSGTESYGTDPTDAPVGTYVPKLSARIQASGEASYPSDTRGGALFGQLVFSTSANAKLSALDVTDALAMPGVVEFIGASAVPGQNCTNPILGGDNLKEKVFFEIGDLIPSVGVCLGVIVAATWTQARLAAKQVVQRYDVSGGQGLAVGTIDDALRLRRVSTMAPNQEHRRRGVDGAYAAGVDVLGAPPQYGASATATGTFLSGGQRHFYMETQSCLATPVDGNKWEIVCSDQDGNFNQLNLAAILNIPAHNINVKTPRAGGAFGGKLLRQLVISGAAAVAANELRKPVLIQMERSDDLQMIAGRESIRFEYEVAYDPTSARVDSLNLNMAIDTGWFFGDASGDLAMAVAWSDNCFDYPSGFKVTTTPVQTNTPHSTAMRAPGCMQSIMASEVIMEHVAKLTGKTFDEVQEINFYNAATSPKTPFGDTIGKDGFNWTIPQLWKQLQESSDYAARQASVASFNKGSRWVKKGIALTTAKYPMGLSFYSSGALVCAFADGTVEISSGGSELGQGLNTKVALCVAQTLGIPLVQVNVGPRETSKVPNNTPTGGSGTSECSAQAAINAAQKLKATLQPYQAKGLSWDKACLQASTDGVSLMETGWYKAPTTGNADLYATYGAAVSEVMVDVLTGEVRVERVDILMDLGNQLDAAIDLGQLEGGFVIALGHLLTEQLKVDAAGTQLFLGTWEYKIPSAYDIPVAFNTSIMKDTPNPVGVKGSKASAEPAMCLIPSVYFAVKNAIYAAKEELGLSTDWFMLDTPLTPEAVRTAINVPTEQLIVPTPTPM
eukprot:m.863415 g.863415  ORF g.863415 m.863415 type:complete len:1330 (-) comp23543_c0_seq1:1005-4994(-)